jgi:phage terminase large subunit-like protein
LPNTSASDRRSQDPPSDTVTAYARDVVEWRVTVGRLVHLACQRHLDDLEHGHERGLVWSAEHAQHAIDFFAKFLVLPDGEHAGEPFVLAPTWEFVVGSLCGWFNADGYRRFRNAYIEAGKGSAKTPVGAGLLIYAMVADGDIGAQCYVAAASRDQARTPFTDCKRILGPNLLSRTEILEHNIAMPSTGSFVRTISSEGRTLDGKRVHFALLDELHEHRDHVVVNKMRAGTKNNRNSLILEITNSGFDRLSVCWDHHEKSRKIVEGTLEDDEWFAFVCTLDPCEDCRSEGYHQPKDGCSQCDNWTDDAVWPKTNPLLGVSLPYSYLRTEVKNALDIPSSQSMVKRLNFCIWTSSHLTWIPADRWRQGSARIEDDDLVGVPCYGGLDLGQSDDFSAFAIVFMLDDGRVAVRMRYWIPEATKTERPNRPYAVWERAGLLFVTKGDTLDGPLVQQQVIELCERYGVRQVGYDQQFIEDKAIYLNGQFGNEFCVNTPQGYGLNAAIVKISDLVKTGKLYHGGDPVLAWMVSNVLLRQGTRNEVRLDKPKSNDKIDGVSALAMAISRAILQPEAAEPLITVLR